jgi:hypothetical protein
MSPYILLANTFIFIGMTIAAGIARMKRSEIPRRRVRGRIPVALRSIPASFTEFTRL